LDHPLLIAEAIRKGTFQGTSPEILAGGIAPFVWDRVQQLEIKMESPLDVTEMRSTFQGILEDLERIRDLKTRRGFENPPVLFWPAAALNLWARQVPWDQLLSFIPVDEGDMASLVVRTADHLRQVANLQETHPDLTATARTAFDLILREPVFVE
jgi:superfamily II RNA helicase